MAHLVSLPTNTSVKDLAKIFINEVWKDHELPTDIVSDQDIKVTSHFWQALMDLLGIQTKLSTAFHPETDGQAEWMNRTIEQYLRHYCSWKQDDWEELLPWQSLHITLPSTKLHECPHSKLITACYLSNHGNL